MTTDVLSAETAEESVVETPVETGEAAPEEKPVAAPVEPEVVTTEDPQKKNHSQRRFERILSERAEYKAKAEMYERMMNQNQPEQTGNGEPRRENFDSDLSYLEARQDFLVKRHIAEAQPRPAAKDWDTVVEQAKATYADFEEVLEEARENGVNIPPAAHEAMSSSQYDADIRYYLAKNPGEARKILKLTNPVDQIRAIGRIEATIEAKRNVKQVKTSAAPKPIAPVQTNSGEVEIDPDKMSDKEYWQWRKKQLSKK